ncbi:hypothetical protein FB45DRAFT_1004752 [Roridomyces roridus]|uniref:Uncharacterized protein n=1 Tax=Roridomyces roridus TaxID=1738132 RepID=A0AAD7BQ87_9AGAR|nr:hypothetical protein FB45DRAFT_1004752 [Roridomyces roridus]
MSVQNWVAYPHSGNMYDDLGHSQVGNSQIFDSPSSEIRPRLPVPSSRSPKCPGANVITHQTKAEQWYTTDCQIRRIMGRVDDSWTTHQTRLHNLVSVPPLLPRNPYQTINLDRMPIEPQDSDSDSPCYYLRPASERGAFEDTEREVVNDAKQKYEDERAKFYLLPAIALNPDVEDEDEETEPEDEGCIEGDEIYVHPGLDDEEADEDDENQEDAATTSRSQDEENSDDVIPSTQSNDKENIEPAPEPKDESESEAVGGAEEDEQDEADDVTKSEHYPGFTVWVDTPQAKAKPGSTSVSSKKAESSVSPTPALTLPPRVIRSLPARARMRMPLAPIRLVLGDLPCKRVDKEEDEEDAASESSTPTVTPRPRRTTAPQDEGGDATDVENSEAEDEQQGTPTPTRPPRGQKRRWWEDSEDEEEEEDTHLHRSKRRWELEECSFSLSAASSVWIGGDESRGQGPGREPRSQRGNFGTGVTIGRRTEERPMSDLIHERNSLP